jgi:protein-tyrosine phosphatase
MVYWINRYLGTKSVGEQLKEGEYNSVLIDCRYLADGHNEPIKLVNFMKNVLAHYDICQARGQKLVLYCEDGISRSNAVAVALLISSCGFEYTDAIEYVKTKVPRMQIEQTLLAEILSIFYSPASKEGC